MTDDVKRFAERGIDVTLHEPIAIIRPAAIFFGSHVLISEFAYLSGGLGLHIGSYVHIGTHASILGGGHCVLEDFSTLCAGVRVITGSEDLSGEGLVNSTIAAEHRSVYRSFVHLARHAFLATNAVVHPGITIGEGAVVGSGAVVTRDVEPWTVSVGAPARVIRSRPRDRILELARRVEAEQGGTTPALAQLAATLKHGPTGGPGPSRRR